MTKLVSNYDVLFNFPKVTSGNGGVFYINGKDSTISATGIKFNQPRSDGGKGGVFYMVNTGINSLTFNAC